MKNLLEKITLIGLPKVFFEMTKAYFRVEVEGTEHLPRKGKALIAPNHSGLFGLDAFMLGNIIYREINRVPRILALWSLMKSFPSLESAAEKMGLKEASSRNGIRLLNKNNLTIIFPEGVAGSFKPSCERYKLQYFHTGFIRMALLTGAPIIPCVIIGAEESNINLAKIEFNKLLNGITMPIPLNLFPLPAKWKIRFLPQINLSGLTRHDTNNKMKMQLTADKVKKLMQRVIESELLNRKFVYFNEGISR